MSDVRIVNVHGGNPPIIRRDDLLATAGPSAGGYFGEEVASRLPNALCFDVLIRALGGPAVQWRHTEPTPSVSVDEAPTDACCRELREELGLDLDPGPLLALGRTPPRRPGRNARFSFVFGMGTHHAETLSPLIRLQASELDAWQWCAPERALDLLHPDMTAWLTRVRQAWPCPVYVEHTGTLDPL